MPPKYQLETIPVWDALGRDSECLLCDLEAESERRNTEFFLGPSVMAPEMRVQLNRHGFCPRHLHMLGSGTGKLGYALALATHVEELRGWFEKQARGLSLRGNRRRSEMRTEEFVTALDGREQDCLMCDRIRHNLDNYAYTMTKLFATNDEFRHAFGSSRGVCLHHLPLVLRLGVEQLGQSELAAWQEVLLRLTNSSLERLGEELEQFTWQFDATSSRSTPDSAQDSVPRTVMKLAGFGPQRLP